MHWNFDDGVWWQLKLQLKHILPLLRLLAHFLIAVCCGKEGTLTCDQSLSQDKDHYREVHFPQSVNP